MVKFTDDFAFKSEWASKGNPYNEYRGLFNHKGEFNMAYIYDSTVVFIEYKMTEAG